VVTHPAPVAGEIIRFFKNTGDNVTTGTQILQTTVRKFAYKAQKYGVDYRQYR